jgi:hypothetical protein
MNQSISQGSRASISLIISSRVGEKTGTRCWRMSVNGCSPRLPFIPIHVPRGRCWGIEDAIFGKYNYTNVPVGAPWKCSGELEKLRSVDADRPVEKCCTM